MEELIDMEELKKLIKPIFQKFYKGYLPDDILESVIKCCENNKFFYDKIIETRKKGGTTGTINSSIEFLIKDGYFIEYLEKNVLEKFLLNLPEEKKKNIKAEFIPNETLEDFIKNDEISIDKKQKILGFLNYRNFKFEKFCDKSDKETVTKLILQIIDKGKLKEITNINFLLEEIMEKIFNNSNSKDKEDNIERLELLMKRSTLSVECFKNEENIKKFLLEIAEENIIIKQIDFYSLLVNGEDSLKIFKELYEDSKTNEKLKKVIGLIDYEGVFYCAENLDDIKFILEIIPENFIKKNYLTSIEEKEFFDFKEFILSIKDNELLLNKFCSLPLSYYTETERTSASENVSIIKKIIEIPSEDDEIIEEIKKRLLSNPINKEIIKYTILNLRGKSKEKLNNYLVSLGVLFNYDEIKDWLLKLDESKLNNKEQILRENKLSFDFLKNEDITNLVKNDENEQKIAENLISIIDKKIISIKEFSEDNIKILLKNDTFKKCLNNSLEKLLKKELILKYSNKENNYDKKNEISDLIKVEEFIEIFKEIVFENEDSIDKVDLSSFDYNEEDSKKIIEEIIKNRLNKLPKFNIEFLPKELLYLYIKENKIKSENINVSLDNQLYFLGNKDKFDILQKIIIDDKTVFLENGDFNFELIEKLADFLTESEIDSFIKFYCESQNIEFNEQIEEKLREIMKDFNLKNDLLKFTYEKQYAKKNKNLEIKGREDAYLLNRQNNLQLLLTTLRKKFEKRLNALNNLENGEVENEEEIEDIKTELKENINKVTEIAKLLKKEYNGKGIICEDEEILKIFSFVTEQYCSEVLRSIVADYQKRIIPFLDENFKDGIIDKNTGEKITLEEINSGINSALGILFDYKLSNYYKLEAQKQLKKYLNLIGGEYKKIMDEKFNVKNSVSGNFLMLSSICEANGPVELNEAIGHYLNDRMVKDYLHQMTIDLGRSSGITDFTFFRGFNTDNNVDKIIDNFMKNPESQTGRLDYTIWDMIQSTRGIINNYCESEGGGSRAGSLTSFSVNAKLSGGVISPSDYVGYRYGETFMCAFCLPENSRNGYFDISEYYLKENIGFDVPIENRIFAIKFKNSKLYSKVESVKFCEKMDFVVFKLKDNFKKDKFSYNSGQVISQEELKEIMMSLTREDLTVFLNSNLSIERVFDKFMVLNEEEKREYKIKNPMETLETEKILKSIKNNKNKLKYTGDRIQMQRINNDINKGLNQMPDKSIGTVK